MATKNDITGDSLISKTNNESYRNNYDLIFGKKDKKKENDGGNQERIPGDLGEVSTDLT